MALGIRKYFGYHFVVDDWADGEPTHAQPIGSFIAMRMNSPFTKNEERFEYLFSDDEIKTVVSHCASGLYDIFYVKRLTVAGVVVLQC